MDINSSDEDSGLCLLPAKQTKTTDWNKCVICQLHTKETLSSATSAGITKFQNAMQKRKDDIYARLQHGDLSANITWHRNCYAKYTSEKNLRHVKKRTFQTAFDSDIESKHASDEHTCNKRSSRSKSDGMNWSKCIFCQKTSHKKDTKLYSVTTFSACQNILDAVEEKTDLEMLTKIRDVDLIAAEAKYHKACRSQYTAKRNIDCKSYKEPTDEDTFSEAFNELVTEIGPGIKAGKAYTMTYLLSQFKSILEGKHICADSYRSQRLKNRLQNHFQTSIVFHQQPNPSKPELVYSSDVSLEDVINASATICAQQSQKTVGSSEKAAIRIPYTTKQLLYHASQILKADVKDCKGIDIRPVNIDDLNLKRVKEIIPQSLYWILRWVITEKKWTSMNMVTLTHDAVRTPTRDIYL